MGVSMLKEGPTIGAITFVMWFLAIAFGVIVVECNRESEVTRDRSNDVIDTLRNLPAE